MKRLTAKQGRELKVLLGLVEEYIKSAKPVGSNTLKEAGFEDLSSATIRNYFANLEELGFLKQQHTSGGRIPTDKAYRLFAEECLETKAYGAKKIVTESIEETREVATFLQNSAYKFCQKTGYPTFFSSPRFDHDFVIGMRLISIDSKRVLVVLITDFGVIKTEQLSVKRLLNKDQILQIETYFEHRLHGKEEDFQIPGELEQIGKSLYNEAMVRFISTYSSFTEEDVYRTGISHILKYPDFFDTVSLTAPLTFFENTTALRIFLRECRKLERLSFWVGDDLIPFGAKEKSPFACVATPYFINKQPIGALALLGPSRMPYDDLFSALAEWSQHVSETLTSNLYKHQITFREAKEGSIYLAQEDALLLGKSRGALLEDKRDDRKY